jgi:hypothetical protein
VESLLLIVFTFGIGIFFALSMIEVPVWKLIFLNQNVPEEDVRFTHEALKRLTSKLPLSNGFVILSATTLMIFQGNERGWDFLALTQFIGYWTILLTIVMVFQNPKTVASIRTHNSGSSITELKSDLRAVGRDHHLGLLANIFGLTCELIMIGII